MDYCWTALTGKYSAAVLRAVAETPKGPVPRPRLSDYETKTEKESMVKHAIPCLGLLLLVPCLGCVTGPAEATVDYRPAAVAAIAVTPADVAPVPPPAPTPGKCLNCDGTGKLGDGTVTVPCPVCGGDGRTDNEPPPTPVKPVSVSVVPVAAKAPAGAPATFLLPPHDAQRVSGGNCAGGSCGVPTRSYAPRRLFGRR